MEVIHVVKYTVEVIGAGLFRGALMGEVRVMLCGH